MTHPEIIALIIAYTCVGVFVATSFITVLALAGFLKVEANARNKLFAILIFEIVVIAVGSFANYLAFSPEPLGNKIDDLRRENQTFRTYTDKYPPITTRPVLKPAGGNSGDEVTGRSHPNNTRPVLKPAGGNSGDEVTDGSRPIATQPDLKPRVYFHIRDESQRAKAKQLADKLEGRLSVNVPGIQRIDDEWPATELRYFKKDEDQEAKRITDALSSLGLKVSAVHVRGFESSTKIQPRHYELWIVSNGL